jgi:NAD(P)-dependent dehydrogenase (short-subunit alcohol dehydrogenase family)
MPHIKELFDLTGKKALITGGVHGIGYSMAEGLAEAGASIAICSRGRHGSLEEARNSLTAISQEVIAINCDVSKEDEVINMISTLKNHEFSVDILVNNAGISWGHPSESLALNDFTKVIEVNLTGVFLVTKQIVREFMLELGGSIINIASVSGFLLGGEVGISGYAASKAGLVGMTKQLAIELIQYGIRVNAIAPSWFPSYMTRSFTGLESPLRESLIAENPMNRFGEPWELKGIVVFLASQASSYINGVVIPVDGGVTSK